MGPRRLACDHAHQRISNDAQHVYVCEGFGLLFSQVQLTKRPPRSGLSFDKWALHADICVEFRLSYAQDLVCAMCVISSVLCAEYSLCYVPDLVCVMYGS